MRVNLSKRELDPIYKIVKSTIESMVLSTLRLDMPNYILATIVAGFVNKGKDTSLHFLRHNYHKDIVEVILHQTDIVPPDFIKRYTEIVLKYKYTLVKEETDEPNRKKRKENQEMAQKVFDAGALYSKPISDFEYEINILNGLLISEIRGK